MSDLCLTKDEIAEITGKQRPHAQLLELNRLGITAKQRGNLSVLVFRHDLSPVTPTRRKKIVKPDFEALTT